MASMTITDEAYRRLRADLLSGAFNPGEKLKIDVLCRSLGTGSSAVREALSRLAAESLVVAEPQRGFRVAPLSFDDLRDLTEARCEIEGLCLRGAVERGGVDWEAAVMAALHRLSRTPVWAEGGPGRYNEEFAAVHSAFHAALAEGCGNSWLLRVRRMLYDQHERYRWISKPPVAGRRDANAEHRAIAEAAIARDGERAARLMAGHLRETARVVLDTGTRVENDRTPDAIVVA